MRAFFSFLVPVVGLAAAGYLLFLGLLYSQQSRYLYPEVSTPVPADIATRAGFEQITLEAKDGVRIFAWWKAPQPGKALVLYFHGNGGNLLNRADRARMLTEGGRGLLLVSYRGYSGAQGRPSEEGLRQDAEAAYRYLASYRPERIVLYGESLGSGVAVRLASENRVAGVILDAPFTSVPDVARRFFWYAPVDLLVRDQYRSIDRIAKIGAPLLVLHGRDDGLIPVELGERLFAAAQEPKKLVTLPGVDHVSVLEAGGLPHVQAFLAGVEERIPPTPAGEAAETR